MWNRTQPIGHGVERCHYGLGTYLDQRTPWGLYVGGRALCADGKVRALKRIADTADTFFSVPASVTADGRTVAGYVTVRTSRGLSTPTEGDPAVVMFVAYQYRKNADALPNRPLSDYAAHASNQTDQP